MKKYLTAALLLAGPAAYTQSPLPENPFSVKVVPFPGTAAKALDHVARYMTSSPGDFFFTNRNIADKDRERTRQRVLHLDYDMKAPGLITRDTFGITVKDTTGFKITGGFVCCYKAAKGSPFDLVTVYIDLLLLFGEDGMKIGFVNPKYTNQNSAMAVYKDVYAEGRAWCSAFGLYSDLLQCKSSVLTVRNIDTFVRASVAQAEAALEKALQAGDPADETR
ncbi:hypothetical protein [Taibaiella koreensis]|uniref:hypothetical protein n=1 Tax=Taibaiella koreensis TaxID=1268548 RepID=UPI000E59E1EB|nr:hypothetical protein [Taibaiella koreensis]